MWFKIFKIELLKKWGQVQLNTKAPTLIYISQCIINHKLRSLSTMLTRICPTMKWHINPQQNSHLKSLIIWNNLLTELRCLNKTVPKEEVNLNQQLKAKAEAPKMWYYRSNNHSMHNLRINHWCINWSTRLQHIKIISSTIPCCRKNVGQETSK